MKVLDTQTLYFSLCLGFHSALNYKKWPDTWVWVVVVSLCQLWLPLLLLHLDLPPAQMFNHGNFIFHLWFGCAYIKITAVFVSLCMGIVHLSVRFINSLTLR